MDIARFEQRFDHARRLLRELLHRRLIARKAHSALAVDIAIRSAKGARISSYERLCLRIAADTQHHWQALARLQVASLRQARNSLMMVKASVCAERRAGEDRRRAG